MSNRKVLRGFSSLEDTRKQCRVRTRSQGKWSWTRSESSRRSALSSKRTCWPVGGQGGGAGGLTADGYASQEAGEGGSG